MQENVVLCRFLCTFVVMLEKTEAIVLHTLKYGEAKLVVDMFTRLYGRMTFMVPLSQSPRSKMKKQYFQPLTLLNIETDVRQQAQMQKLHDISLLMVGQSLLSEPSKVAIALFISEFLYHALRDEQRNEPLFDYLCNSIDWLDKREHDYANFHLVFLIHMSRFLGFYPNLEEKNDGALPQMFDLREGTFRYDVPIHRDFLAPDETKHIHSLMRMDYATMHLFKLNRANRNRILDILVHYYRLHLPAIPEIRSLEVFRELYG